ncbi:MAG: ABC transporter substrate-binding protein [Methylobacter sp.]|nr:ABC transporter substrate-binding protein [Methylobacter sp.]
MKLRIVIIFIVGLVVGILGTINLVINFPEEFSYVSLNWKHIIDKPVTDIKPSIEKIAVNIPLSGPIAAFSGEYANGLRMGIEDGCKELNVPCDKFELDVQDNTGKPVQAVSIMEKQRINGFDAYISGTSEVSLAIAKELDTSSAPHLLVSFDAFITSKGVNRLRILPHFKIEGPMYAKYAKMRSAKRVFSIILNNVAILEEFDSFVDPELKKQGMEFQREVFDWGFKDFNTLIAKVKKFQPDLILISGYSVQILPIIQSLRAQSMLADGNVLCGMDFIDLLYSNTPIGELTGAAYIAPPFEIPGMIANKDGWQKQYNTKFGKTPNYIPAFAYDTGRLLVLSYSKTKGVSKNDIKAQLPYSGISGNITVDDEGDLNSALGLLKVNAQGKLELLSN